jgi:FixJ family two-component response regulator/anti-sigma regulatory factor (Ser/Thr protein kinase)
MATADKKGRAPWAGGEVAGASSSSLEDLAAGLAHEINNPLAIIVEAAGWVADLLAEGPMDAATLREVHDTLLQITTQAARCKEITHNLLSYARRTAGRREYLQLNDVITEVTKALRRRAEARGVSLELRLASDLPQRCVSFTEIQQVLVNLINNALDALEGTASARIEVATRVDGDDVVLEVSDTGPGIPPEVLPRIFDPFFTTKPVGKGTGLGLSICYGIVTSLGGTIDAVSRPQGGTTFRLRLPEAVAPTEAAPLLGSRRDDEETALAAPRARPVVLVADDEQDLAETLAKRLARRQLVVLTATSGEETVRQVDAHPGIDVVLLDVRMPDMDGIEVLRELKRRAPLIEVILLSGHSTVEVAIEGLKLGAFDYLVKPCELELLLRQIEKAQLHKLRAAETAMEARIQEITSRRL